MIDLSNLSPNPGAKKKAKRVGRGDTTAGKGTKGQKARSGGAKPRWFEGGQMPLYRRLPKRGFKNPFRKEYQVVNLDRLDALFDEGAEIDKEALKAKGLIRKADKPVKILARGEINKPLTVKVDAVSASAKEKIEAAGGKVLLLAAPKEEKGDSES
ncbi:MAG: 50S ribosomal protein L15 [Candidatus Hydrothermota bacterium]|uniref:Large ribosomal subunit protein uL15 n=1 Tax=candidate division WOR-3 bacterium TaxID=2052148 RepID=A0A7C1BFW9_UNCW3|nr:MAG: 50S ribosomal protein L15 [Candidatus Hydrothermae bacterium]HDM90460.1 50S ribosomal protein L15 [candidate division WOR-3 bacterium]